jgi:hypothetical protein
MLTVHNLLHGTEIWGLIKIKAQSQIQDTDIIFLTNIYDCIHLDMIKNDHDLVYSLRERK